MPTLSNVYAATSAAAYGLFALLLMFNLSGPDKRGIWFKPDTFFPLWTQWDPMVVVRHRSAPGPLSVRSRSAPKPII